MLRPINKFLTVTFEAAGLAIILLLAGTITTHASLCGATISVSAVDPNKFTPPLINLDDITTHRLTKAVDCTRPFLGKDDLGGTGFDLRITDSGFNILAPEGDEISEVVLVFSDLNWIGFDDLRGRVQIPGGIVDGSLKIDKFLGPAIQRRTSTGTVPLKAGVDFGLLSADSLFLDTFGWAGSPGLAGIVFDFDVFHVSDVPLPAPGLLLGTALVFAWLRRRYA